MAPLWMGIKGSASAILGCCGDVAEAGLKVEWQDGVFRAERPAVKATCSSGRVGRLRSV